MRRNDGAERKWNECRCGGTMMMGMGQTPTPILWCQRCGFATSLLVDRPPDEGGDDW
ncbi:MAG: hypothetical protein IVW52_12850 [Acidimicrobiales bacterium]|nr:hypothetical protein [Acidimicrobiales bacterium]